jgi:hypothetical protein
MTKYVFILILAFFTTTSIYSQQGNDSTVYFNTAFNVGEKLKYEVKYGLIKGGEAMLGIGLFPSGPDYVYYVKAIAYTTGVASKVAQIYDIYESYIDIQTGYPIKAVRNIKENTYTKYDEVLFYQSNDYVISLNNGKIDVPDNTLDILSAFYFTRRFLFNQEFNEGQEISLTTFFDGKIFPIKIKFKEKETIKTVFGKVECLKFVPIIELDSPFKKEDDMEIWFSDDGNFIPVKIKMEAAVGNIKCDLIEYEALKNPFGN